MPKPNKITEYAIKYLFIVEKKSVEDISKELKVSVNSVNKLVQTDQPITAPARTDKTKDLMIRQTSSKKNNSVSIMTEAASQLSDDFVKTTNSNPIDTSGHIFRPRG